MEGLRVAQPVAGGGSSAVSSQPQTSGTLLTSGATDEGRPVCMRCQRWSFECDGPRGTTFIYAETVASSGLIAKQTHSATISSRDAPDPTNSRPLPRTALGAVGFDACICYTREHLQQGGLIVSAITDMDAVNVLPAETTAANRRVSHQAILSFATILFGLEHQQVDISRHGYALYGVTLTQLNQALASQVPHPNDEVIMAVATLAIAECLVPSGKNNYLDHMMGLQKLIDLQDPSTFWPNKPYGFRNGVRFMLLFASLQVKNPCILARPEWKTAMRVNSSPKELREQDLYDILADCTILLAQSKSILEA